MNEIYLDGFMGIRHIVVSELTSTLGRLIENAVKSNPDVPANEIMSRVIEGLNSFAEKFATKENIEAFIVGCKKEKQS